MNGEQQKKKALLKEKYKKAGLEFAKNWMITSIYSFGQMTEKLKFYNRKNNVTFGEFLTVLDVKNIAPNSQWSMVGNHFMDLLYCYEHWENYLGLGGGKRNLTNYQSFEKKKRKLILY